MSLADKHCVPCEGGVPTLTPAEVDALRVEFPGWEVIDGGTKIRRGWTAKHFRAAIEFFDKIRDVAEAEGHHPDLHLEGYRNVTVVIWTHAIGGLSENDFILAAKIDAIDWSHRA